MGTLDARPCCPGRAGESSYLAASYLPGGRRIDGDPGRILTRIP